MYTDGSAPAAHNNSPGQPVHQPTKRRMGSGIYRPAGHTQGGNQEELRVRLDPVGHGITNTINWAELGRTGQNWAELAPIEHALREGVGTQIASDSACSLYQIARMIHIQADEYAAAQTHTTAASNS